MHALASDGLLLPGGGFVLMPPYDERLEELLTETYRGLVLFALVREERLTEGFRDRLLTFRHGGGFSATHTSKLRSARGFHRPDRRGSRSIHPLASLARSRASAEGETVCLGTGGCGCDQPQCVCTAGT